MANRSRCESRPKCRSSSNRRMTILLIATLTIAAPSATSVSLLQETPATAYKPGAGVKQPILLKHVAPKYPRKAMDRRIEGVVWLSAVVLANGKVGAVRVTKSLDNEFGLDDEAVKTVRKWRFTPGTKEGTPVAVEIEIEMSFTLRPDPPTKRH